MTQKSIELAAASIACGCLVGSIYLSQAIGLPIVQSFGMPADMAGIPSMVTMLGYSVGLVTILCVGSYVNNRYLITAMAAVSAVSLAGIGLSNSFYAVLAWAALSGVSAIGAQLLIAHLSSSASSASRGRAIGILMGGLITGIMLSRPMGHIVTDLYGWRMAFVSIAAIMALTCVLIFLTVSDDREIPPLDYVSIIRKIVTAPIESRDLRDAMILQGVAFFVFNLVWSALPLALDGQFAMRNREIALFSVVGVGGAFGAVLAGWLSDTGRSRPAITIALCSIMFALSVSYTGILLHWIFLIAISVLLTDFLVQLNQVLNQRSVLDISEKFRGAYNAAFMTTVFISGSVGSLSGAVLYEAAGWTAIATTAVIATGAAMLRSINAIKRNAA